MPNIADALCLDFQVQIFGTIAGGGAKAVNTVNTLHYRRAAIVNPVSEANFLTAWSTAVQGVLLLALNNKWTWNTTKVRCLNDATDIGVEVAVGLPGLVAGDQMPDVNAVFIYHQAPFRGKSYKGSIHFGPLSESDTTSATENILNAAAITRWTNVFNAYKGPITDASPNTFNLETFSRIKSKIDVNPTIVTATPVGTCLLNKRIGRLNGRERREGSVY
jgi:hypothetical protein